MLNLKKYSYYSNFAGPGSKINYFKIEIFVELLTIVICDALVNRSILNECRKKALLIYAGKTKRRSCSQMEINQLLS